MSEINQVTIAICGNSGAGKTTSLVAAAASEGFGPDRSFSLAVNSTELAVFLNNAAESLYGEQGAARCPPPTTGGQAQTIDLMLRQGGKPIVSIRCFDYAGGQLLRGDGVTKGVREATANADALVVYLDAAIILEAVPEVLADPDELDALKQAYQLNRYKQFIDDFAARADQQGRRLPMVVVLTKFDLLFDDGAPTWSEAHMKNGLTLSAIRQRVKAIFHTVFGASNKTFKSYIIPLSLGRGLGLNCALPGRIAPLNAGRHFGAAAYEALLHQRDRARDEQAHWKRQRESAQWELDRMGVLDTIIDDIFNSSRMQNHHIWERWQADQRGDEAMKLAQELEARISRVLPLVGDLKVVEGHDEWQIRPDGTKVKVAQAA